MSRGPRLAIPTFDPPPENSSSGEPEFVQPAEPASNPEPDVGDVSELADQRYSDYSWSVWRQRTSEEIARNPKAGPRSFVTRIVGPVDIMAFQAQHGGGIYEFWAYLDLGDGNGRRYRFKQTYPIDGPRKDGSAPAPAAAPAAAHSSGPDPQLAAALGAINRMLERLDARAAQPAPPAPAVQAFPFKELVELTKMLNDRATPALAGASVTEMMSLVQQGIELGKSTQPGTEPNTVAIVLEKLAPSLERLASTLLTRRPSPPAMRRPPGGPVASTAHLVNEPEPPAPPSDDETRMSAAVDALARAVIEQTPPDDFAFVLEHTLSREQVAMLRLGSTEQVMQQLTDAGATVKYPILATEAAAPYLDSVLTELRTPATEGEGD